MFDQKDKRQSLDIKSICDLYHIVRLLTLLSSNHSFHDDGTQRQFKLEAIRNWGRSNSTWLGSIQIWTQFKTELTFVASSHLNWIQRKDGGRGVNTLSLESVKRGLLTIVTKWLKSKKAASVGVHPSSVGLSQDAWRKTQCQNLLFVSCDCISNECLGSANRILKYLHNFDCLNLPCHGIAATLSSPAPSLRSLLWSPPPPPPLSGSNSLKITGDLDG